MAGVPGMASAGVQFTLRPVDVFAAVMLDGAGGPDCRGPLGQPPIPGPPGSPYSAMVRPWRLASASSSSQAMARSPSPAFAAISALAASSKTYVAVKVSPANLRLDE